MRRVLEQAEVTKDKAVITYCTIGNRASEAWFALKYLLDYPDVRVYYGSWVFQHYQRRGGPVAATRLVSFHLRSDASGGTDASDRIAIVRPRAASAGTT